MSGVIAAGAFDDLRSRDVRFLQETARLGEVHVELWSDADVRSLTGRDPKFGQAERRYLLRSLRYVRFVHTRMERLGPDVLRTRYWEGSSPGHPSRFRPDTWVVDEASAGEGKRIFCEAQGLKYHVISEQELAGFPQDEPAPPSGGPKVIVTGCYDWFHSGHVRFFEEASRLGELYVVVGHDANLRLLKGEGHPMFPQEQRRYVVGSVRCVHQALISTGHGWMDSAPEIERIRPDIYLVNEDGDKPEKRAFCREHGIEYRVLQRVPKEGLPARQSTNLRGF